MAKAIFRKTALDRMSSPEQLDRLVTVTSSKAWIALVTLLALIGGVIVWGFVGSLPSRVSGNGIFITQGGSVFEAVAPEVGVVSEIRVLVDDLVEEDQVVAVLSQREMRLELDNAEAELAEREEDLERMRADDAARDEARNRSAERQIAAARETLEIAQQRLANAEEELSNQERLFERGIITTFRVQEAEDKVNQARTQMADARRRLAEAEQQRLEGDLSGEQRLSEAESRVSEALRRVRAIRARLERGSLVRAPSAGRVTEIQASPGAVARRGEPLMTFESVGEGLELLLYIPPMHGKQVEPGMRVQIAPNTAQKEEFGTVIGEVVTVSNFPATREGMIAVLKNEELVRQFSQQGPPYRALVRLQTDGSTVSGYAWTSDRGGTLELTSGTLADAEITVREQKPITMVLPLLREWTGL